jgi:GDPmannose 4,6-dehydratase
MAKRALITGVTGQDGSYLAELLVSKGYEVFGLVRRLSTPNMSNLVNVKDKMTFIDGDLTDQSSLNNAVKEAQPDEVYNLAAQSFVQTSFKQPILTCDVSGTGVVRMLEAVRHHAESARFYQASTSELYGLVKEEPQSETTPFHPRSPYGFAKLMGYWAVVNYRESYGMHASNGILFNHESPRRGIEFVTRKISAGVARMAMGKTEPLVLGNLEARRDWGYAPEYVEGMHMIARSNKPDDYVLATGSSHSVREFLSWCLKRVGLALDDPRIQVNEKYYRPAEVHSLMGNSSKVFASLGWKASTMPPKLAQIMVDADLKILGQEHQA